MRVDFFECIDFLLSPKKLFMNEIEGEKGIYEIENQCSVYAYSYSQFSFSCRKAIKKKPKIYIVENLRQNGYSDKKRQGHKYCTESGENNPSGDLKNFFKHMSSEHECKNSL